MSVRTRWAGLNGQSPPEKLALGAWPQRECLPGICLGAKATQILRMLFGKSFGCAYGVHSTEVAEVPSIRILKVRERDAWDEA